MRFAHTLVPATFLRRYKRFLVDVRLDDGSEVTVHCPNSGRMTGLDTPEARCWLSPAAGKGRKLPYTLELVDTPDGLVGINTGRPNAIVAEAIGGPLMTDFAAYPILRREVRYGANSRIDILLEGGPDGRSCYVEVKNVHMRRQNGPYPTAAEFPDAVTARGAKHLRELTAMVAAGHRAVLVYLVQRADCDHVRIAGDIDRAYADTMATAMAAGVEAVCLACRLTLTEIVADRRLALVLEGEAVSGNNQEIPA